MTNTARARYPEPLLTDEVISIDAGPHLKRVKRQTSVLRSGNHTPKDPFKRAVHDATIMGLEAILRTPSRSMRVVELELHLLLNVPNMELKRQVVQRSLFAITRMIRKQKNRETYVRAIRKANTQRHQYVRRTTRAQRRAEMRRQRRTTN